MRFAHTLSPASNQAQQHETAPAKPRTMLRRLLSHHEIATLLVLLHSPISASAKPELPALQEDGLVEVVSPGNSENGLSPMFRLTADGTAVLKGLGLHS